MHRRPDAAHRRGSGALVRTGRDRGDSAPARWSPQRARRCVTAGVRRAGEDASHSETVSAFRKTLGRSILAGLELLVAADIIRTVAIEPTMQSVLRAGRDRR